MIYLGLATKFRDDMNTAAAGNPLLAGKTPPSFDAIRAEHVRPAVRQVLAAERTALSDLAGTGAPSLEWLRATETMIERVNAVWSPIAHLNSVTSSPEFREAYNECLADVTAFFSELGQNEAIYAKFAVLAANYGDGPEAELIRQSLRDFRLAGVALTGEAKEAYRQCQLDLAARQAQFEQHVMDANDAFEYHETDRALLSGLPEQDLERARAAADARGLEGWLFRLDPPTYQTVLTHADRRELREHYYRAWVTRASDQGPSQWDNSPVIEEILRLRWRSAELLGFPSYAALSLARKMAKSEQQVLDFLEDLARRSRGFAEQEIARLEQLAGQKLAAWDMAYYSEKLKQASLRIGAEELRAYFPLPRVLAGLFELAERLFGIHIAPFEDRTLWHETAQAFSIANLDGTPVGTLLADFYSRPNKRGGAWMDSAVNRSRLGEQAQNPVAHLVCNFAPPTAAQPSYITHTDVVTLFHEFGHTLHHLLTEIDYPSIAGVNGVAWDAVELPSQFFENFAWRPEVLRAISAHRETGERIPDAKIDILTTSRTFLAALAMIRQIEFALFDFRLHARATPANRDEVQAILDETRTRIGVVPVPDYNRFQCSFTHIFSGGYAAGYYSYKWAEVLSADAFAAFEEKGAFDAATAERFRRNILAVGGSRDAMQAFVAFRGRPPELDPLLRQAGIIA
jgi:oligopeptidase A